MSDCKHEWKQELVQARVCTICEEFEEIILLAEQQAKVYELECQLAEAKKAIVFAHAQLDHADSKCLCKYCHPGALGAGKDE